MNLDKFKHKSFCDGRIIMINADCKDVMVEIGDKEIDLVLTDPPYGINAGDGVGRSIRKNTNIHKGDWDIITPPSIIFEEMERVSKNQIIWGGNYFSDKLKPSMCWLFWSKPNTEGRNFADGELAYTSFNKALKVYRKSSIDLNRFHPTQKPIQLMAWCLNNYSKENDLIFDAFAGSFTTAIACIRTKRRFIGVEFDSVYFEKAVERVETELRQEVLF